MRLIEPKRGLLNSLKVKLKESTQGKWVIQKKYFCWELEYVSLRSTF